MLGYTVAYSTLDNNRNPTSGLYAEFKQDFAGIGGDVNFIRSTAEARTYYEMFADVVAVFSLQGGHIAGWGGKELRMLDHFQMGPNLVRGFAPAGLGPRDLTSGTNQRSARRHACSGARALEAQAPFTFLPKDVGLKGAVFADVGSLWDYKGPTFWNVTGETITPADDSVAARVGRRRPDLEFAVRSAALRLLVPAAQSRTTTGSSNSGSAAARSSSYCRAALPGRGHWARARPRTCVWPKKPRTVLIGPCGAAAPRHNRVEHRSRRRQRHRPGNGGRST